ncbi:MAG: hypothetical protein KJO11_16625 [Gemmatimonadetes bacterium]|nr:hypothetical protein [Gemmatimonadota bacterium]NNF37939.1 hypothetical protein [Gemmatimonadota bacterium]
MNRRTNEGRESRCEDSVPGIIIAGGDRLPKAGDPRISAFIWGGKVRPTPTLPYGRLARSA